MSTTVAYTFEGDTLGQAPADITFARGTGVVVDVSGDQRVTVTHDGVRCDAVLDLIPDLSTNQIVDFVAGTGDRHDIVLLTNDNVDRGYMVQLDGATDNKVEIYRRTPASPYSHTLLRAVALPATIDGKWQFEALTSGGTTTIKVRNWDGAAWADVTSITDTSYTSGRVAIGYVGSAAPAHTFGDISVEYNPPEPMLIDTPGTSQIVQRNGSGVAAATVTASGTYTGSPVALEYQVDGGGYSTFDASPAGGTWSVSLGTPATGQHTLDVRWTDTPANIDSVTWGVGDVFLIAGQSNAEGRATNAQTYSGATLAGMYRQNSTWSTLADPTDSDVSTGSPWPAFLSLVATDQAVPVGIITTATGNTALGTAASPGVWHPDGTANDYDNSVTSFGSSGAKAVRAILWHQGESDANNGVSQADYLVSLQALAAGFAANVTSWDGGDVPVLVAQLGYKTTGGVVRADLDAIRLAQAAAWDLSSSNLDEGPTLYDVGPLSDGVHFSTDAQNTTLARRWWLCVDAACYDGTATAPKIASAAIDAGRTLIDVTVSGTLDANLTTYGAGGWSVTLDDVAQSISSVTYNSGKVRITLASAAAAGTVKITFASFNDGNAIAVPRIVPVTLPDETTMYLPLRPALEQSVTGATSVGPITAAAGFPAEIVVGDAYTTAVGRAINLRFTDAAGLPVGSIGTKSPADADFTFALRLYPMPHTGDATATIEVTGDGNDWDESDTADPFLSIELTESVSADLTVATGKSVQTYLWQVVMNWSGADEYSAQSSGTVVVRRKVGAAV